MGKKLRLFCLLVFPLIFGLISLLLLSCSDPKLENPFDPESGALQPMAGELSITQLTDSSVKLTWQLNNSVKDTYVIYRKTNDGSFQELATVEHTISEYTDTGLLTTNTYTYQVIGKNDELETEPLVNSISTSFREISNFEIEQQDLYTVKLTWDHNCSYETGYIIERREIPSKEDEKLTPKSSTHKTRALSYSQLSSKGTNLLSNKPQDNESRDFVQIADLPANNYEYTDENLTPNHTYEYRIHAYSELNVSPQVLASQEMTFPAPTNLLLEQISWTACELTWDYSGISGEDGFKVRRRLTGGSWIEIAQLDINTTYYEDTGLTEEATYEYMVYAYSSELPQGNAVTESITMEIVCTDIDGNVYEVVKIGDQYWMAENLKVTHYRNGDSIPNLTSDDDWTSTSSGAYCCYDNDPSNADTYGALYNWYAVDDGRGLAPEGWHVPTDEEIKQLEMHLGMSQSEADDTGYRGTNQGSQLAGSAALWTDGVLENDPEFGSSGFDFLPGGYRNDANGSFYNLGYHGYFWSATESITGTAWKRRLSYNSTRVFRDYYLGKQNGFSVRCLRD